MLRLLGATIATGVILAGAVLLQRDRFAVGAPLLLGGLALLTFIRRSGAGGRA